MNDDDYDDDDDINNNNNREQIYLFFLPGLRAPTSSHARPRTILHIEREKALFLVPWLPVRVAIDNTLHVRVILCAALRNALGFSVGLCKVHRCVCLLTHEQLGLYHVDWDCSEQWTAGRINVMMYAS